MVALGCLAAGVLYLRGWLRHRVARKRLGYWPLVSFLAGLVLIYGVMQTHMDYLAQHMLWIHRVQHLVLHHLGPLLMVLGAAHETLPEPALS